jgi:hypothetical protein
MSENESKHDKPQGRTSFLVEGVLGVEFGPRVKRVKQCEPEDARSTLTTDRHVSTRMPCMMAVWEGDGGRAYLAKMNIPLMARMFGGNIAKVVGGNVAQDEHAILSGIVQD